MSVLGTNLAAAVAGTSSTAEQLARARDKQLREQRRAGARLEDTYETHLKVPEEDDAGEATAKLVVDDLMQERTHEPGDQPACDDKPKKRLDVTG